MNQVIHGDCLVEMQDIPDKSIDMILCDLPYGTTACKWDTIIPFEPLWEQYKRIIKDNGAIVLTASQPFTSALVMSNIKMFKYSFVWDKKLATGHLSSKIMPMKRHEDILVFGKGKIVFNPQLTERNEGIRIEKRTEKILGLNDSVYGVHKTTSREYSHRQPTSIIEISNANRKNRLHPTQKPVALFEYLIKTYTNEGDLVLDNCAGSGTAGVACRNINRRFILIEKEQEYIDIIHKRLDTNRYTT